MKRLSTRGLPLFSLLVSLLFSATATAQPSRDFSEVEIVTHQLTDNLYYLEGAGGNIAVSTGEDGVLLVDDQFAPLSDRILEALAELDGGAPRFVLNTHHHGDHVGGNADMAAAGAVVVAHDKVRQLLFDAMAHGEPETALTPQQRAGLPMMTFNDSVTLHFNDEEIHVFHLQPAHTGGDAFVYFKDANVIHTGDVFRTTGYPVVDQESGGTLSGIIESYQHLLSISDTETVFLPGHGEPSSQQDLQDQLVMIDYIRERVREGIEQGMSLEAIQQSRPTADYEEEWGQGRVKGADLVAMLYEELMARQPDNSASGNE